MKAFSLSVDAGNNSILSKSFAKKYGIRKKNDKLFVTLTDVNGYTKLTVEDTYNGELDCVVSPEKDDETYYVGDACYIIEKWDLFLKDTDNLTKLPNCSACVDTGGDGFFLVRIET